MAATLQHLDAAADESAPPAAAQTTNGVWWWVAIGLVVTAAVAAWIPALTRFPS